MTFFRPSSSYTEEEHACGLCGFEGTVAVWLNPHQERAGWECPDCHTEHDEPWDLNDDPDRWRE